MRNEHEAEFKAEAERLTLLDVDTQRHLIAEQRAIAANPKVPKRDREYARERANALKRHLFPRKKGREKR